jgi:hypothetical protein
MMPRENKARYDGKDDKGLLPNEETICQKKVPPRLQEKNCIFPIRFHKNAWRGQKSANAHKPSILYEKIVSFGKVENVNKAAMHTANATKSYAVWLIQRKLKEGINWNAIFKFLERSASGNQRDGYCRENKPLRMEKLDDSKTDNPEFIIGKLAPSMRLVSFSQGTIGYLTVGDFR